MAAQSQPRGNDSRLGNTAIKLEIDDMTADMSENTEPLGNMIASSQRWRQAAAAQAAAKGRACFRHAVLDSPAL
jgi:hypothetical protein